MKDTKIQWATHTFNPWVGCTKISPGCDMCYAEGWAKRAGSPQLWAGDRRRTTVANWRKVERWNADAEHYARCTGCGREGDRRTWVEDIRKRHPAAITCCPENVLERARPRVFCASLADVFDNQVPDEWRFDLWMLIERTPHLDWLLLTKRPQNMAKMLPWSDTPWPHVWLGTTAENQEEADRRIPTLLQTPAAVRFVSAEPLLGPVDFTGLYLADRCGGTYPFPMLSPEHRTTRLYLLDWIIVGGESGPGARPCDVEWIRSIVEQCRAAGVAAFVKQLGANSHGWCFGNTFGGGPESNSDCQSYDASEGGYCPDGKCCMRIDRKGSEPEEWPENLRVRELPR